MSRPADGLQGLKAPGAMPPIGTMPNAPQQDESGGILKGARFGLAFVEFDDQGRCYDRRQMKAVADHLQSLGDQKTDAIVIAYVHGWKHNARTDDDDVSAFRHLLALTVAQEASSPTPRPVLGIFVGWRGKTQYDPTTVSTNATFWDRQAAGQRVAVGSVRELFGRLRAYRRACDTAGGNPLLVIAGHSFGGMIVFSAVAQSLIEAATTPDTADNPSFADLVLIVNPAIEGSRYLPIHDLKQGATFKDSLPVFLCVQAENDEPVGTWFVVGNAAHRFEQAAIGPLETDCITRSIGFVPDFRTHDLKGAPGAPGFQLTAKPGVGTSPFWVIGADQTVIDGHGGIWGNTFLAFLKTIVFAHVNPAQVMTQAVAAAAAGPSVEHALQSFAAKL